MAFRIGVASTCAGLLDCRETVGAQYADLGAPAVFARLWPVVDRRKFSRRHGVPPGRGAVIVAWGRLAPPREPRALILI